jgi:heterodisulfide reductase subunit B
MRYAFFEGCNIPIRIQQYSSSMRTVLEKFNVTLEKIDDFNCCGYPARNVDETAYFLPSMRNMAIAEKKQLDIFVICNCCFASLQKTKNILDSNRALRDKLNLILEKEGLTYTGKTTIKHFLTVLHEDLGIELIRTKLTQNFKDLRLAVIQGCHILRPREITRFDDAFIPHITDTLLSTLGISNLDWQGKLECCGAALAGINNDLSKKLLQEKLDGAQAAGADYIMPICSYCYLQFDTAQRELAEENNHDELLPVLLFPQLLGLCLGIEAKHLGLTENETITAADVDQLLTLLSPPEEDKKKRKKKAVTA